MMSEFFTLDNLRTLSRRNLSGIGYLIADAAYFAHGLMEVLEQAENADDSTHMQSGIGNMVTAGGWATGNLLLARYGHETVHQQLERVENRLYDYLRHEGAVLDADAIARADTHAKRTLAQKLEDYLHDNPTEVFNSLFGAASLGMLHSGIVTRDAGEIFAASCEIAGALTGIFLKEKTEKELANAGPLDKLIHSKPLAVSSAFYLADSVGIAASAVQENIQANSTQSGDTKYLLKYMAAGFYAASDLLLGSESKKAGGSTESRAEAKKALYGMVGALLAEQPEALREPLLRKAVHFLSVQKKLRLEDDDRQELTREILAAIPGPDTNASLEAAFQEEVSRRHRLSLPIHLH